MFLSFIEPRLDGTTAVSSYTTDTLDRLSKNREEEEEEENEQH